MNQNDLRLTPSSYRLPVGRTASAQIGACALGLFVAASACGWEDMEALDGADLATAADVPTDRQDRLDRTETSDAPLPPAGSFDYEAIAGRLEGALPAGTVQRGVLDFFEIEDCLALIEEIGNCLGNNPASPYGAFHVPPAPGEFADPVYEDTGLSPSWRLRPDEALIFIGLTPPRHKYLSFRSYLVTRERSVDGERTGLLASLGDSLSHPFLTTTELGADAPWNEGAILITTANAATQALLRAHLDAILSGLGLSTDCVNTDIIPQELPLRMGLGEADDQFNMAMRVALPSDREAAEAYRAHPPAVILRFTPQGSPTSDPIPTPTLRSRAGGADESDLAAGLSRLKDAVARLHPGAHVATSRFIRMELEGYECIDRETPCLGDNRDTSYSPSRGVIVDSDLDAVYVVGVNHAAASDFTYSSISGMSRERLVGFASVDDSMLPGSVDHFVPDLWLHASVKPLLFVWKFARSCDDADVQYCTEIPLGPIGVNDDETLMLIERAYLNVRTLVGADIDEIERPWLVVVR